MFDGTKRGPPRAHFNRAGWNLFHGTILPPATAALSVSRSGQTYVIAIDKDLTAMADSDVGVIEQAVLNHRDVIFNGITDRSRSLWLAEAAALLQSRRTDRNWYACLSIPEPGISHSAPRKGDKEEDTTPRVSTSGTRKRSASARSHEAEEDRPPIRMRNNRRESSQPTEHGTAGESGTRIPREGAIIDPLQQSQTEMSDVHVENNRQRSMAATAMRYLTRVSTILEEANIRRPEDMDRFNEAAQDFCVRDPVVVQPRSAAQPLKRMLSAVAEFRIFLSGLIAQEESSANKSRSRLEALYDAGRRLRQAEEALHIGIMGGPPPGNVRTTVATAATITPLPIPQQPTPSPERMSGGERREAYGDIHMTTQESHASQCAHRDVQGDENDEDLGYCSPE